MPHVHEIATLTSKGQITLPKAIRQALGVVLGGKLAFDLRGSEVIVTLADEGEQQDPAIGAFLSLLENDIQTGTHLGTLPDDLVQSMLAQLRQGADSLEEISGDVAL